MTNTLTHTGGGPRTNGTSSTPSIVTPCTQFPAHGRWVAHESTPFLAFRTRTGSLTCLVHLLVIGVHRVVRCEDDEADPHPIDPTSNRNTWLNPPGTRVAGAPSDTSHQIRVLSLAYTSPPNILCSPWIMLGSMCTIQTAITREHFKVM